MVSVCDLHGGEEGGGGGVALSVNGIVILVCTCKGRVVKTF